MPNNNSVSLEIRWMPEGGKSYDERFHWQNKHLPEVAQWIRTPAVYMNQVLAIAEQITRLNSSLPSITSIMPSQGPLAGGTEVTISGVNFTGAISVTFGGKPAVFTVDSDGIITAFTPPGVVAGPVSVVVTTPSGSAISPTEFTYVDPPTITGVNPPSGPTGGGNTVTITGTNFTAPASVTFGGNAATNVTVVNATTITITVPCGYGGRG